MKRVLTYSIASPEADITIASYLRMKGYSRHILTRLKNKPDGICLNQEMAYANVRLKNGDHLTITLQEDCSSMNILPVPLAISIVYEDADLLIIDKAADMPIHPSINNFDNTLANGIAWYFYEQGIPFVYRCINRLDRDTTGLLIVAKHMLSGALLSEMLTHRKIRRTYLAIASGCVPFEGTIDAPIARKDNSAIERCVDFKKGEQAVTHFKRIAYKNGHSLVALTLETGRTHQIRVHMKHLGFPLVGDYLYHPDMQKMQRQALHSHCLEFNHPITNAAMKFTSPLPADMDWL